MHERILSLAAVITGGDTALLEPLCAAAETAWRARLRPGVAPSDCESALICAAAFSAAAGASSARDGGRGVSSFTAGDVSVRCREGGASSGAAELLAQAERLMAPYVVSDDFAFRGVRT